MIRHHHGLIAFAWALSATTALAQAPTAAQLAPGQTCALVTQANADASAGTPNISHDGTALPGQALPDISLGSRAFRGRLNRR